MSKERGYVLAMLSDVHAPVLYFSVVILSGTDPLIFQIYAFHPHHLVQIFCNSLLLNVIDSCHRIGLIDSFNEDLFSSPEQCDQNSK